jgi:hypothetical protein
MGLVFFLSWLCLSSNAFLVFFKKAMPFFSQATLFLPEDTGISGYCTISKISLIYRLSKFKQMLNSNFLVPKQLNLLSILCTVEYWSEVCSFAHQVACSSKLDELPVFVSIFASELKLS